jgi:hypothetical protein
VITTTCAGACHGQQVGRRFDVAGPLEHATLPRWQREEATGTAQVVGAGGRVGKERTVSAHYCGLPLLRAL